MRRRLDFARALADRRAARPGVGRLEGSMGDRREPFGARLVRLRKATGWSRSDLARRTGLSESTLYRIESGQARPKPASISRLAGAFGLSTQELQAHSSLPEQPQLALFQGAVRSLHAHYARAVTQVPREVEAELIRDGDVLSDALVRRGVELYRPAVSQHPSTNEGLPAEEVYAAARSLIVGADLLVLHGGWPSFGVGQELEIAASAGVPVLLLNPASARVSRMVLGCRAACWTLPYDGPEQLRAGLDALLPDVLSRLREGRTPLRFGIGPRLRALRLDAGLTTAEIGEMLGVSEKMIRRLEEPGGEDRVNPPLAFLASASCCWTGPRARWRRIATPSGSPRWSSPTRREPP
jgi:transcriptional regulator with XRE-family HTH domain